MRCPFPSPHPIMLLLVESGAASRGISEQLEML